MTEIRVFTEDSEFVDAVELGTFALEILNSILYGDLSYYEGPRIVQIPMNEDKFIGEVQYLLDINADCFGTADRIELVLC